MMLLLFVMALTDKKNAAPSFNYIPVFVGLLVIAIGMTLGMNSGYAINPARDLSPRIFIAMAGWGSEVFTYVFSIVYRRLFIAILSRPTQPSISLESVN